jgi:release factor glutamine methyltransferase
MSDGLPLAGRSLAQVLARSPLGPLETRILLGHALGLSRVQLITRADQFLSADDAVLLQTLFERRLAGEPIAYLTGEREFYGLDFRVTPAVLIPRPDTELLVELACARLPRGGSVLDMGTGSGAIAVAIAHARPDARVSALDASAAALEVAHFNAVRHGAQVGFVQSDWYAGLAPQRFSMIVANPPYIVAGDRHLAEGDLRFEPVDALTDHADGLSALRAIVAGAPAFLADDGWLLMEHGYDQAAAVRELLQGWDAVESWRDLAGIERVTGGMQPKQIL